ncbi:hypothetical protein LJB94_01425, partial [Odoribacter sp. OttesenSCG-928-G04]|nr:hypothetical protein [Odoribacter sp. OttesenSCG-928-G04]
GAFFGYVDYAANNIGLHLQKLNGSSGNCLLVDNNKIWAISGANGGLSIIEGERTEYKNMPFAKYVLKLNDQMVVLSGEKKAEDVIESKLSFFDLNENLVDEYVVGNITPIDGKNAMVTDGTTIYLALGRNGVKAFRNGQEVAAYNPGEIDAETGKVLTAANCVEVDDQYLYVANDKAGLYILDKTDLSLLCKYTLNGGASANFVKKADNGDIYVSYGLKGVNVFRLIVREVDNVAENVQ